MEKIIYAVHKTHTNALKNALHKEYDQFISAIDRLAYDSLQNLKQAIKTNIANLNEKHRRCKAIEVSFTDFRKNNKTTVIFTNTGVHAEILEIKIQD